MKPSNSTTIKSHLRSATDMSFKDIIKGTASLAGNTVSLSFKAVGATVYIANKVVNAGLNVGKAAYDEVKEGYTQTNVILSSPPKPMATRKPEPTELKSPEQMEFEFNRDA